MKPIKQIDFIIEEFFNTGNLHLNKEEEGITFDQLEVDPLNGKTLLKEFRNVWQQFMEEYIVARDELVGQAINLPLSTPDWKNTKERLYNVIIDKYEMALDIFNDENIGGLSNKQKEVLLRVYKVDEEKLLSKIEEIEGFINNLPQEEKERIEIEKNRHKEEVLNSEEFKKKQEEGIEQLNTLFAKKEMTADEKSSQYMELLKKVGYIAQYYYNIEKGVEEKKEGHYNRALSYFVRAKSQLEDAVRELNVPLDKISYYPMVDWEIRDLSGEYDTAHDDILPLFKKDQLILPKDEYWLKLLEKGEGVEVKIETKNPTYGDPYIIFKGIETNSREGLKDVDKETWGSIFAILPIIKDIKMR